MSVAAEIDIQECERLWRKTHTLMSATAHPTEVQEAADAALTLTSQVWHFEPSDAIEAVITKIERRSPLTFTRPEIGTMGRYRTTSSEQWHTITAKLWGGHQNQTKVSHMVIRLYGDRDTRVIARSKTETQLPLPSEARPPLPFAKQKRGEHSARHRIRARRAGRRDNSSKSEKKESQTHHSQSWTKQVTHTMEHSATQLHTKRTPTHQ